MLKIKLHQPCRIQARQAVFGVSQNYMVFIETYNATKWGRMQRNSQSAPGAFVSPYYFLLLCHYDSLDLELPPMWALRFSKAIQVNL